MAQPYGGPYSPTPQRAPGAPLPPPRPVRVRKGPTALLALTSIPFFLSAFFGSPLSLLANLGAGGLILAAALFTREGQVAQAEYDARKVARRPAIPRKLFGSVALGIALALGSLSSGLGAAVALGLLGAGLHLFSFGLDPMRDKGAEGIDPFQQERVARVTAEAERHLAAMREAILRAGDRKLEARVSLFTESAREMMRAVEEDPRDLSAARRYLGVYLEGASAATARFADIWAGTRDPKARADYEALLNDLERNFTERRTLLLQDNTAQLNIEIEVLRDRLSAEDVVLRSRTGETT